MPNGIRQILIQYKHFERVQQILDGLLLRQRQGAQILNAPSQLKAMQTYYQNPMQYHSIPCTAGITSFLVDAYGNVRLCFTFEPIGNIRARDPHSIWKSTTAMELRRRISQCRSACRIMNHIY